MKSQGVRGRAIAGDCWDLGALRDGNYGSRFSALSRSVLLACCPLHGFIRPRSKGEGRRASQQKRSVNKDLPHQQSCGKGDACHSPLPHNHAFLTQRLSICPVIPPSLRTPCWFPLEEPQLLGRLLQQQGPQTTPVPNFPSQARVGLSHEVKITHWLFMSKSSQSHHTVLSSACLIFSGCLSRLWAPNLSQPLFFDPFWNFCAINLSPLQCLVPSTGRPFRISCGHGCPN